ncbi:hypothetical protein [Streptomyces lasiicapitis]|uniref:Uncharacterized protein n=1 Tax=Streptomyces lasiicapitis TaxID=1923961 RepID=A0ABQ2LKH0_9ACTN|nr:hypothetical protein [Streptomyces lasiicapitis]GGO38466.1 hypothetical protein GCM10012286_13510 [Streptomyces lasiicapitis]
MSDAIIPIAFFLILAGAIVAVAKFQTERSRERDREYAAAMESYRKALDATTAQQEAIRTQLTELNVRVQSMESMLRAVD